MPVDQVIVFVDAMKRLRAREQLMDINVQMLALVGALSQKESPEWRRAIRRIESDAALPSEEKQFATMAEMRAFASNFK